MLPKRVISSWLEVWEVAPKSEKEQFGPVALPMVGKVGKDWDALSSVWWRFLMAFPGAGVRLYCDCLVLPPPHLVSLWTLIEKVGNSRPCSLTINMVWGPWWGHMTLLIIRLPLGQKGRRTIYDRTVPTPAPTPPPRFNSPKYGGRRRARGTWRHSLDWFPQCSIPVETIDRIHPRNHIFPIG